jgi:two-component system response regulator NreC
MPTRFLVVDDHGMMREGLRRLINTEPDYETVGEAADCDTAWASVQSLQPDFIIMDIDMPGEGGIALTFRIKSNYPAIKTIVLTGHLDPKFAGDALRAGASGYLLKTNGASELIAAIKAVQLGQVYLCAETTAALFQTNQNFPHNQPASTKPTLPKRELEVLLYVVQGLRNKEIATKLDLNVKTVETYRSRIMKRLNCSSPAELVRYAIREGLATP